MKAIQTLLAPELFMRVCGKATRDVTSFKTKKRYLPKAEGKAVKTEPRCVAFYILFQYINMLRANKAFSFYVQSIL